MRDNNQTAHFKFVLLLYAFFPRKSLQTTLEDCKYRFVIKLLARAIKRKPQPEKTRLFLLFRKRINQPTNHAEAKALERKHAHTKKKKKHETKRTHDERFALAGERRRRRRCLLGSRAVALTRRKATPSLWPRMLWTPSRREAWKSPRPSTSFFTSTAVPRILPSFHASLFLPVNLSKNPCTCILADHKSQSPPPPPPPPLSLSLSLSLSHYSAKAGKPSGTRSKSETG
jgi:hypothetical protein